MRDGRASRTAGHNALFRALAAAEAQAEPPLDDPLAKHLLTGPMAACRPLIATAAGRRALRRFLDRRWPGVRTSVVARTALIDRAVTDAVEGGLEQVVLLGAGYDTRAHRLPALRGRRVFEVDHPDTQRVKRAVLDRRTGGAGTVSHVPSDFETASLGGALRGAGHDPTEPTLFVWEGVTNYLSAEAVDRTLRWIAGSPPTSRLVFTYVDADLHEHPERYRGVERLHATLARVGEDLRFAEHPAALEAYLADRGLRLVTDVGAAEYRRRHYGAAADAMVGHEFYRVAVATIPEPAG